MTCACDKPELTEDGRAVISEGMTRGMTAAFQDQRAFSQKLVTSHKNNSVTMAKSGNESYDVSDDMHVAVTACVLSRFIFFSFQNCLYFCSSRPCHLHAHIVNVCPNIILPHYCSIDSFGFYALVYEIPRYLSCHKRWTRHQR